MIKFEAIVDSTGLAQIVVKGDSIEEIAKAIPEAISLFFADSKGGKRAEVPMAQEVTGVPKWIVDNVSKWESKKERNKVVYSIFLMKNNAPMLLDQIKQEAKNLGVNLDDWLVHNFKRDMNGDVVEAAREGRKRSYKLSAVGIKKADALREESAKSKSGK